LQRPGSRATQPARRHSVSCAWPHPPRHHTHTTPRCDTPGEFPPKYKAGERSNHFYYKHFPQGGYLSAKNGDGSSKVSVSDYLRMAGKEGSAAAGK
jgi:hypothetical protein